MSPRKPPKMSENVWKDKVIDTAIFHGWRVHHSLPAIRQSGKWSTPVQGHTGLPDLILARHGVVVGAELKTETGQLDPEQQKWLDHFGPHGCLWRPSDWDAVLARLARPKGWNR